MVNGLAERTPAARLEGVTVTFGRHVALDALDLQVARGATLALVGANGAGKTTAIRVLCGLQRPTAGRVEIHGVRQPSAARASIGYCPQSNVFYDELTVIENLQYVGAVFGVPWGRRVQRAHELAAGVGLADKADARASRLSGGMQRRLTLAIACMHDPALLVAEEPEAGLDPHSRALIRDFLSRYGRDHTLVFSSHHVADVERLADVVAVLNDGRVVALGHPRAVARMAMSKRPRVPGPRRVRSRSGHAGRAASPRTAEVAA